MPTLTLDEPTHNKFGRSKNEMVEGQIPILKNCSDPNLSIICELASPSVPSDSAQADLDARHLERALEHANSINRTLDSEWVGWKMTLFRISSNQIPKEQSRRTFSNY